MRQSCACGGRIYSFDVSPVDIHNAHFRCDKCGRTFSQSRRGPSQPRFAFTEEFVAQHKYSVLGTDTSILFCSCTDVAVAQRIADLLAAEAGVGFCVRYNPTGEIIHSNR